MFSEEFMSVSSPEQKSPDFVWQGLLNVVECGGPKNLLGDVYFLIPKFISCVHYKLRIGIDVS